MKATIIYDNAGNIWHTTYGDSMLPVGVNAAQLDLPDNTQLTGVEIAEDGTVTPKYESMPLSDWQSIQKAIDSASKEADAKITALQEENEELSLALADLIGGGDDAE